MVGGRLVVGLCEDSPPPATTCLAFFVSLYMVLDLFKSKYKQKLHETLKKHIPLCWRVIMIMYINSNHINQISLQNFPPNLNQPMKKKKKEKQANLEWFIRMNCLCSFLWIVICLQAEESEAWSCEQFCCGKILMFIKAEERQRPNSKKGIIILRRKE